MRKVILLWIATNGFLANLIFAQPIQPSSFEKKILVIPEGQSRTFMFTNRLGVFYYGETGSPNSSTFQGLSYLTEKILDDYVIELNGVELSRTKAEVQLVGDKLIRSYKSCSIEEEVALVDSLPILIVRLKSKQKTPVAVAPLIASSERGQAFTLDWSSADKILHINNTRVLVQNADSNSQVWIGVYSYPEGEYSSGEIEPFNQKSRLNQSDIFCPGKLNVYLESEAVIFFIIGNSKNEVLKIRNRMLRKLNIELQKPRPQIEGVRQA
ncbi:hypothetical protein L0Z72_06580, partial [candidate division KSB1 bacterium]|nr:hypothetical protein [candidate division KSB1 bacterium]